MIIIVEEFFMRNLVNVRKEVRKFLLEGNITVPDPKKGTSPFTGWTISRDGAKKILEKIRDNAGSDPTLKGNVTKAIEKFDEISDEDLARGIDLTVNRFIKNSIAGGSKYTDSAGLVAVAGEMKNDDGMIKIIDAALEGAKKSPKAAPIPGYTTGDEAVGDTVAFLTAELTSAAQAGTQAAGGSVSQEIVEMNAQITKVYNSFTTEFSIGPSTNSIKTLATAITTVWVNPSLNTSGDTLGDSVKSCATMIRVINLMLEKRNNNEVLAAVVGGGIPFLTLLAGPAVTKALSAPYFKNHLTRRGESIGGATAFIDRLKARHADILAKEVPEINKMIAELRKSTNVAAIDAEITQLEQAVTTMEGLLTAPVPAPGVRGGGRGGTTDARKAIADNITSLRKSIGTLAAQKSIDADELTYLTEILVNLKVRHKKLLDEFFYIGDLLANPEYAAGLNALKTGAIGLYTTRVLQLSVLSASVASFWLSSFAKGFDTAMNNLPKAMSSAVNLMGTSDIDIGNGDSPYEAPGNTGELYQELTGTIDRYNIVRAIQEIRSELSDDEAGDVADSLQEFILSCLSAPLSQSSLTQHVTAIAKISGPVTKLPPAKK